MRVGRGRSVEECLCSVRSSVRVSGDVALLVTWDNMILETCEAQPRNTCILHAFILSVFFCAASAEHLYEQCLFFIFLIVILSVEFYLQSPFVVAFLLELIYSEQ